MKINTHHRQIMNRHIQGQSLVRKMKIMVEQILTQQHPFHHATFRFMLCRKQKKTKKKLKSIDDH